MISMFLNTETVLLIIYNNFVFDMAISLILRSHYERRNHMLLLHLLLWSCHHGHTFHCVVAALCIQHTEANIS